MSAVCGFLYLPNPRSWIALRLQRAFVADRINLLPVSCVRAVPRRHLACGVSFREPMQHQLDFG